VIKIFNVHDVELRCTRAIRFNDVMLSYGHNNSTCHRTASPQSPPRARHYFGLWLLGCCHWSSTMYRPCHCRTTRIICSFAQRCDKVSVYSLSSAAGQPST